MHAHVLRRKALTLPLVALMLASGLILARSGVSDAAVGDINTVAGTGSPGPSGDGGAAAAAGLTARSIVSDNFGNYFIGGEGVVRRVDAGTGIITTVATGVGRVVDLDMDSTGNLYIFDTPLDALGDLPPPATIRKVDAVSGAVNVLGANLQTSPPLGQSAQGPSSFAVAGDGTIYIGWPYQIIRYNNALGGDTVVAGTALPAPNNFNSISQAATDQKIGAVGGIAVNPLNGNAYFTDTRGAVIRINSNNTLTIVAGGIFQNTDYPLSTNDFTPTQVRVSGGTDLAFDSAGAIYVINFSAVSRISANGAAIRRIIGDLGVGPNSFAGDGGPADDAELYLNGEGVETDKGDVTVRPNGDVLLADGGNLRVRATSGVAALGGNGKGLGPGADRTPPTADFAFSPATGVAGEAVSFTDQSTGGSAWSWSFGDGTAPDTSQNPIHIYANSGSYTVTLTVTKGSNGQTAQASKQVTVAANPGGTCSGTAYCPVTPVRILETRPEVGLKGTAVPGPVPGGGIVELDVVSPLGQQPANVEAVVMNVTGIATNLDTFLTVFPTGSAVPNASNVNLLPGQVKPNLVIAKVGANGKVSFFNAQGNTHILADVMGWLPAGSDFSPLDPARVLDTRASSGGGGPIGSGQTLTLDLKSKGGLPASGLGSVVMNVTATEPTVGGFLTVFPGDVASPPNASNLNFEFFETTANLVIAKTDANGQIKIYNPVGNTNVIVDVLGFMPEGSALYTGLSPARVLETRPSLGPIGVPSAGKLGPLGEITLTVTGTGGVPATGVGAVVLNVTATELSGAPASFVTVYPNGAGLPNASNLNVFPFDTAPNLVIAKVGANGQVRLFNANGNVHLIADVVGFFPA